MGGYNPEYRMLASSETRLSEAQEALYPLLVPQNEARAVKMDEFRDLYDVDKDMEEVNRMQEVFRKNDLERGITESSRKSGKLVEALTNYGINEGGFLGPDATAIKTSAFDDYKEGVDVIVEIEEEGKTSHIALAIDVTRNPNDISQKFEKNRKYIKSGKLFTAKYFKSPTGKYRGELNHIVRVVVGADQPAIDSLSDLIVRSIRLQKSIRENKEKKVEPEIAARLPKELGKVMRAIGEHPLQWIMLLEIQPQLEASQKYAEEQGQPEVAKACGNILAIINEVIEQKKSMGQSVDPEILQTDRVYQLIQKELKSF